jgi:hypothetical protein
MFGVVGFAAAADYSYFATDGFTSCADNFVPPSSASLQWRNTSSSL